jgi:hypothetical protein
MDKQTAEKVIESARFYTSGDNCQPFRYRFNSTSLCFDIDYLADQAKHTLNYGDHTFVIMLASLSVYLDISLAEAGYSSHSTLNVSHFQLSISQKSVLSVKISKSHSVDNLASLYDTLSKRTVDKREFKPLKIGELNEDFINTDLKHCSCKLIQDVPLHILYFFAQCDCAIWKSKKLGLDRVNSLTFDSNTHRGLPWRNLELGSPKALPTKLNHIHHFLYDILKALGAPVLMNSDQLKLWSSSKSALIFTVNQGLSIEKKVEAGKEMSVLMLQLVQMGYSLQPSTLSTQILNIPAKRNFHLLHAAAVGESNSVHIAQQYRDLLELGTSEVQWILRIGKPYTPMPASTRTNRLPVSALLKFED